MDKHLTNPLESRPLPLNSLLTLTSHAIVHRFDAAMATAGLPDLRAAHAPIFMGIDPGGTRVSVLAERASVTKQAAGELIRYLVDRGYLSLAPDPSDGRAKSVRLTDRGWEAISIAESVVIDFDRWLDELVGTDAVIRLRDVLTTIARGSSV